MENIYNAQIKWKKSKQVFLKNFKFKNILIIIISEKIINYFFKKIDFKYIKIEEKID